MKLQSTVAAGNEAGSRSGRIIFINRYFHPDHSATSQMLSDLAFGLAREGASVAVVTSRQRYDDPQAALPAKETIEGVEVHRIATTRFGRKSVLGRAVDYLTFYLSAAAALWSLAGRDTVVVAKTDPPLMSLVAGPIAWARRARLVNWLQDIFPEVAEESGFARGRIAAAALGALARLRNRSLRRATMNVVLGERMAERVAALGVDRARIRTIPNWAVGDLIHPVPPEANPLRREWGLAEAFVVAYSGNLGRAHEYMTLIHAIELIEKAGDRQDEGGPTPRIAWLFIGGGSNFEKLKSEAEQRGLTTVQFQSYQPRERLSESLSAGDVHIVSLVPELEGLIVPSKYYGIAAVGRAAIFIGDRDGEIARMLARDDSGLCVEPRESAALAQLVSSLARDPQRVAAMGANARRTFDARYDFKRALSAWQDMLSEFAAASSATATGDGPITPAWRSSDQR